MLDFTKAVSNAAPEPRTVAGRATWRMLTFGGLAAFAAGLAILTWPGLSLAVVGQLFGLYLLAHGAMQLVGAIVWRQHGTRTLLAVSGIVSVLLGLMCFRSALQSIWLLAWWIGFGWLLRGIALTTAVFKAGGRPRLGWNLWIGPLSVLAGLVVIAWPFSSIATLAVVSGICLLVLGIVEAAHGFRLLSRELRQPRPRHAQRPLRPRSMPPM
jgi:uncharacterized membrane protein HdeD (DUF308 family)